MVMSFAWNSVVAEQIHLGFHQAPAEIHGSLTPAPSKVWPGHLSTREGGTLGVASREWDLAVTAVWGLSKQGWDESLPKDS